MRALFFDLLKNRENDEKWAYKTITVMANWELYTVKALDSPESKKNQIFKNVYLLVQNYH